MDKEIAVAAAKFMLRVPLRGEEVPAFNAVMQALQAFATPETVTRILKEKSDV